MCGRGGLCGESGQSAHWRVCVCVCVVRVRVCALCVCVCVCGAGGGSENSCVLLDWSFDCFVFFFTVQTVIIVRLYLFTINSLINLFEDSAASWNVNLECTK